MQLSQTGTQIELEKLLELDLWSSQPNVLWPVGAQGIYHERIGMFSLTSNPNACDSYHPTT